jgi:hypothetical protein
MSRIAPIHFTIGEYTGLIHNGQQTLCGLDAFITPRAASFSNNEQAREHVREHPDAYCTTCIARAGVTIIPWNEGVDT